MSDNKQTNGFSLETTENLDLLSADFVKGILVKNVTRIRQHVTALQWDTLRRETVKGAHPIVISVNDKAKNLTIIVTMINQINITLKRKAIITCFIKRLVPWK